MSDLEEITKKINEYVHERDWQQYQKPKDLAMSISIEAAEILELFQWKSEEEIEQYVKENKGELGQELADTMIYILKLAHDTGIDMKEACLAKIEEIKQKYPIEKAKGNKEKYTTYT